MSERLMRKKEVLAIVELSSASLYNYMALGLFPRPVKIGKRAVAWPESVVKKWMEDRVSIFSQQASV